jgi:hypothetical protein
MKTTDPEFGRLVAAPALIVAVSILIVQLLLIAERQRLGRVQATILVCATLVAAALIFYLRTLSKREDQQERARLLFDEQKAIYSHMPHKFRVVDPSEFPDLDGAFYDRMRSWFESKGFRFLGDFQNETHARIVRGSRAFHRSFVSPDGTILGAATQMKLKVRNSHRDLRFVEFESELGDGTFVITTNARALHLPTIPGIQSETLSPETGPDELLGAHYERLARIRESRPDLGTTKLDSIDNIILLQQRLEAVAARHMRSIGYLSVQSLEERLGHPLKDSERYFAAEIERLNQQERAANDAGG